MLNQTFVETCTYATCSVKEYGQLEYIPSLAGNVFYLSIFALSLLGQCILGIRYRTWGYMFGMFGGLALEILGYIARIQLHYDVFSQQKFTNYVIGTTIAPAFFAMSIYLCLARIIFVYGNDLSPLRPYIITITFVCCDVVSILLQAIGGSTTATANTLKQHNNGVHITIAGLVSQVVSMTVFVYLCSHFAWKVWKHPHRVNVGHETLRNSSWFRGFLWCKSPKGIWKYPHCLTEPFLGVAVATITILIRCCFRVAELYAGYAGKLANDEVLYMILEGAMMILAMVALTIGHPGPVFGSIWQANGFTFGKKNKNLNQATKETANDSAA